MTDAKKPWEQNFDSGASGAGAEPWKQDYGGNGPRGLKGWSPEKEPGFADRFKQGVGRTVDFAHVALSGDEGVIAKVAADQQRNALPQTALQRQMAEELAPYNEAAKNAEGFTDSARAWGSLGLKRAGQLLSNPAEAGKMIVEQLPNSIPGLAGGFAGAKAGAAVQSCRTAPEGESDERQELICIVLDRAPSCCRQASSGWTAGRVGARHCSLPHPSKES